MESSSRLRTKRQAASRRSETIRIPPTKLPKEARAELPPKPLTAFKRFCIATRERRWVPKAALNEQWFSADKATRERFEQDFWKDRKSYNKIVYLLGRREALQKALQDVNGSIEKAKEEYGGQKDQTRTARKPWRSPFFYFRIEESKRLKTDGEQVTRKQKLDLIKKAWNELSEEGRSVYLQKFQEFKTKLQERRRLAVN